MLYLLTRVTAPTGRVSRTALGASCFGSTRSEVPERWHRMGVAVRVSGGAHLSRSQVGCAVAVSPARIGCPARGGRRGSPGWDREASQLPHLSALVCHALFGSRVRHPDRAGAARSCGRQHDDDLHARTESRRIRCAKPRRLALRALAAALASNSPFKLADGSDRIAP